MTRWGLGLVGVFVAGVALAAPPKGTDPNSPLSQWFEGLQAPRGGSCCGQADGRITDKVRPKGTGYEVYIDQTWGDDVTPHWEPIPDKTIMLNQHNPTGRWVVFFHHYPIRSADGGVATMHGEVLCVVPPMWS